MTTELLKYEIFLSDDVIGIFKKYIQNTLSKPEAGGILLGQVKGNRIYVIKASIPTIFDKATRMGFVRSKEVAQILVDYEFINSNGRTIYLGEWHTHPEDNPSPSGQDMKMIKEQMQKGKLNEDFVLLFIQGLKSLYLSIYKDGKLTYILVSNKELLQ